MLGLSMAENDTQRRLTAILSADVKGYSKLMGEDDESTVNTITAYREMIADLIEKHRGRVVDTPGDNILAEYGSTLNAVNSAIEIQNKFSTGGNPRLLYNCYFTALHISPTTMQISAQAIFNDVRK